MSFTDRLMTMLPGILIGSALVLGASLAVERAWPRAVVNYCGSEAPEPPPPSAEEIAKMKADAEAAKEQRRARRIAYAKHCVDQRGAVVAGSTSEPIVACLLPAGSMPQLEWLDGKFWIDRK